MKRVLLAAGALLLAMTAVPASAQEWGRYDGYNRYDNGNGYYGNGYGGEYGRSDAYYSRGLRECRRHRALHHELRELHHESDEDGYYDREDHRDTHDSLRDFHNQWHRNHPQDCSYWQNGVNRWSRGYYRNGGHYGYRGGDPSWSFRFGN